MGVYLVHIIPIALFDVDLLIVRNYDDLTANAQPSTATELNKSVLLQSGSGQIERSKVVP